jgi:hypothetical protein
MEYERKRDFQGTLDRLQSQLAEAVDEKAALEAHEQDVLQKELHLRAVVKAAADRLDAIKEEREQISGMIQGAHGRRSDLQSQREALAKREAAEGNQVERGRAQLHDVLQKARVDEIALPIVDAPLGDGRRVTSAVSSDSNSESDVPDEAVMGGDPLEWAGNRSQSEQFRSRSSNASGGHREARVAGDGVEGEEAEVASSSRMSSRDGSAHFSQSGDPTVRRDARAAGKVDLSSMRKHKSEFFGPGSLFVSLILALQTCPSRR